MRYLVIIGLALVTGLLARKFNRYKNRILLAFGITIALMSALYNVRTLKGLLTFVHPRNQTFYQVENLENGDYPDSLLFMLLSGKRVYCKDDAYMIHEPEQHGKNFNYALYHARNEYYLLEYLNVDLVKDKDMNGILLTDDIRDADFTDIGPVNDMLRYCFLYGDLPFESANYFAYYWYYYEYLGKVSAYLCDKTDSNGETVFTSDDLVMFWNTVDNIEEEDLFIMTRDYYENNVRPDVYGKGGGQDE